MQHRGCYRFLRDILTDDRDDYDIGGVTMFLVSLSFIGFGAYHLLAIHAEYRLVLERWPLNASPPAFPSFDLQGWGVGAAALLGGHGINRYTRSKDALQEEQS